LNVKFNIWGYELDKINILIIEKDVTLARELQELLTDMGYSIKLANTIETIVEIVNKNQFDFILLDASYPEISGVEIFQEIQSNFPNCKTILCFNSYSGQIKKIVSELSVAATVQKPFELESLIELVQNYYQIGESQAKLLS
jgi:DNA-binding NtrC family response regulator